MRNLKHKFWFTKVGLFLKELFFSQPVVVDKCLAAEMCIVMILKKKNIKLDIL